MLSAEEPVCGGQEAKGGETGFLIFRKSDEFKRAEMGLAVKHMLCIQKA